MPFGFVDLTGAPSGHAGGGARRLDRRAWVTWASPSSTRSCTARAPAASSRSGSTSRSRRDARTAAWARASPSSIRSSPTGSCFPRGSVRAGARGRRPPRRLRRRQPGPVLAGGAGLEPRRASVRAHVHADGRGAGGARAARQRRRRDVGSGAADAGDAEPPQARPAGRRRADSGEPDRRASSCSSARICSGTGTKGARSRAGSDMRRRTVLDLVLAIGRRRNRASRRHRARRSRRRCSPRRIAASRATTA